MTLNFRCRTHRDDPIQRLLQVAETPAGGLAVRRIEGSAKAADQRPQGWAAENRALVPGLYCQTCLGTGSMTPIADYDLKDLLDAGLGDVPHIGLSAAEFDLDSVWAALEPQLAKLIVETGDRAPRPAITDPRLRSDPRLALAVRNALERALGGNDLYSHQVAAIDAALAGHDVVVETATASGKSLCYWIPALNAAVKDPAATTLYLAPLNALVEDQLSAVDRLGEKPTTHVAYGTLQQFVRQVKLGASGVKVARYDGATKDFRPEIRNGQPNILITNPDMLHVSILPWHESLWRRFLANLRFVIIDEMHVYKGMFGANFANVIRRVLRLAEHYGATPQVIGCSASIGNPMELFTALTGRERPTLVRAQESGAPVRRQKRVVLDPARGDIGLPALAKDLMVKIVGQQRARTITFMRSIPEVDQVYGYVAGELKRQHKGVSPKTVREYKREIPSEEKAEVTADLRTGATLGVISTTALQLGIDIGDLSVGLVCKFPGSKAAFMQQAGRVGRSGESLILFVADSSPLDQHYVARPEELLDGPPEVVFLNAHHRETVLKHLWCAAEELALDPQRDAKYWGPSIQDLIDELATQPGMTKQGREVLVLGKKKGQKAREVNIRSMGFECSVYDAKRSLVAKPDVLRAMRRYHKYARFRIQDDAFEVTQLSINWNNKEAEASAKKLERLDHTTSSVIRTECEPLVCKEIQGLNDGAALGRGDVRFVVHVDGYYRVPVGQGTAQYQHLGPAAPPSHELDTDGLWFLVPMAFLAGVQPVDHHSSLASALEAFRVSAALLCSTDPDDIGTYLETDDETEEFTLYLADQVAGGNGLTEQVFGQASQLVAGALRVLEDCPHCSQMTASRGCARCITTAWGDESAVCRDGGIVVLRRIADSLNGAQ